MLSVYQPYIEFLGERTLLLHLDERIDATVTQRVHAVCEAIKKAQLHGVHDIVPAYASIAVYFELALEDAAACEFTGERIARQIHALLADFVFSEAANSQITIEIPVCYDAEFALDLDFVADRAGLPRDEVVARHCAAEYRVAMLGFAPGFPYLVGLDPTLACPRNASPRTRVPAGSVAIGGSQSGIYPRELPGGWRVIGRSPWHFFDPTRDPPARLAPGQRVRFVTIDRATFAMLARDAKIA